MEQQRVDDLARSVASASVTRRGATTSGLVVALGLVAGLGDVPPGARAKRANRRDHRQTQRRNMRQRQRLQASRNDVDEICGVRPFCLFPVETGIIPVGTIPSGTVAMCFSWQYFNCQTCDGTDLSVYDAECNTAYPEACGGTCTTDPSVRAASTTAK